MTDIYGNKCEIVLEQGCMVTVQYENGTFADFHVTKVFKAK